MPRVALVTGCSTGIGHALARMLVEHEWTVYAGVRNGSEHQELSTFGCRPVELDVCDESQRVAVLSNIEKSEGRLDALVNNAGYGLHGALEEASLDDIREQFETNVFSVARLCQLALPAMRARGSGHIVNMSSMGGRITFPGGAFYHASKHALEAMTDAMRFEVAAFGIRVILIEPGPVRSQFGHTAINSLGKPSAGDTYAVLRESIQAGLASTFQGAGSELSSTPQEVAATCLDALESDTPQTRYVVGDMAAALIEQRHRDGDAAWDAFLETLYARPGPRSEPSG